VPRSIHAAKASAAEAMTPEQTQAANGVDQTLDGCAAALRFGDHVDDTR